MDDLKIKDIPSLKQALEDAKMMSSIKKSMPVLRPLLKLLGANTDKIDESLLQVGDLEKRAAELAQIPDEFNDYFAERGWIIYDHLNFEIAKTAVEKARQGNINEAEQVLVDYYDPKTVEHKITIMKSVEAFRPRWTLARKALIDYREERYHACVPVVLALLDGMISEVHDKRKGFFADEVDLTAWDSLAGHSRGLNVLSNIFKKGRRKTVTETISVPYRNGILHGMDLGYDNKLVAAKTWAALFAAREWAVKAERGTLEAPPEESKKTWLENMRETVTTIKSTKEFKERLASWTPRDLTVGEDLPADGALEDYAEGTPERKLAEYLSYWKAKNYGHAAQCLHPTLSGGARNNPGLVREVLGGTLLKSFKFLSIEDFAAAVTEIETEMKLVEYGKDVTKAVTMRMICTTPEGGGAIRGEPNSEWSVMSWQGY